MTLGKAAFGRNKKGGEEFFSTKKGGRRLFFRKNKGGEEFFRLKKGGQGLRYVAKRYSKKGQKKEKKNEGTKKNYNGTRARGYVKNTRARIVFL